MRALEALPHSGELWLRQGFLEEELDRPEGALQAYARALQHLPGNQLPLRGATETRIRALGGSPPRGEKDPDAAREEQEQDLARGLAEARGHLADGRGARAERELARLLAVHGDRGELLLAMGEALADQERFEDAARYLSRAAREAPAEPEAWILLSQTQERLGRWERARRSLQHFLAAAAPENPERTRVHALLEDLEHREEAREAARRAALERRHVRAHWLHLVIAAVAALLVFQLVYRLTYSVAHDETGGRHPAEAGLEPVPGPLGED